MAKLKTCAINLYILFHIYILIPKVVPLIPEFCMHSLFVYLYISALWYICSALCVATSYLCKPAC